MASLSELEGWLQPFARYLVQVAEYNGFQVHVTSVYRSDAKQAQLYRRYQRCLQEGGDCLPAAPPGRSNHRLRRAFDIVATTGMRSPQQRALGELWRRMGGTWGGDRDPVHFEA